MLLSLFALSFSMQNYTNTPSKDIVVHGGKPESASFYYDSIAPYVPTQDPISRFTGVICASSSGLPDAANHVIVDRVEEIAASVGLVVGKPGCSPNIFIIFVPDSKLAIKKLASTGSPAIASQSLDDIRHIIAQPAPVKAWTEAEVLSRDGDPQIKKKNNEAAWLSVPTSSHLSLPIRSDFLSSTIIIDKHAVAGVDLRQIADYAAVRGLTGAHPDIRLGTRSILSLFLIDARYVPREYTAFDKGYLRGLYGGNGDLPSIIKRAQIVDSITKLERSQND